MNSSFWYRKTILPVLNLLRQGITPKKLALSIAIGIVLGTFPALGTTTLLCAAAAFAFRLNIAAMQLANYLVYPLHLALLIPFIRLGEKLFGVDPLALSLNQILQMTRDDPWGAVTSLWTTTMHAITAWMLIAPLAVVFLYVLLKPTLEYLRIARRGTTSAVEPQAQAGG